VFLGDSKTICSTVVVLIFMAGLSALDWTRNLPTWRVPMNEWFSRPIPELPCDNVTDPELLGIMGHVAAGPGPNKAR